MNYPISLNHFIKLTHRGHKAIKQLEADGVIIPVHINGKILYTEENANTVMALRETKQDVVEMRITELEAKVSDLEILVLQQESDIKVIKEVLTLTLNQETTIKSIVSVLKKVHNFKLQIEHRVSGLEITNELSTSSIGEKLSSGLLSWDDL